MRRFCKITSFLLILVMLLPTALTLTSCHGGRTLDAFEIPESFDTNKQYEIVFWAKNESNVVQKEAYEKAVSDFEALYPNINVVLKSPLYTDYGRLYQDVITNIATGTTPNVCITYPDHIATYITGNNIVVPLDELIADEKYGLGGSELRFDGVREDEIVAKFYDECKIGGVQYALPYMRSTEACYINGALVETLGYTLPEVLTWDFVFEVSRAAMEKGNDGKYINGQDVMIPFIYKSTDNMMIQMLEQYGAEYSNDSGDILIFNEDTENLLYMVADAAECGSFETFKRVSYPGNYLNKGQCIFAIDSTAGATWMGSDAPNLDIKESDLVPFETVVMPIPQFDTENPKMISQGPSICIFNKEDAGEVVASWLFCQFLLTNSVQIDYAKTEGYIPVTTKAQAAPEYLEYLSRAGEDNDLYYDVKLKSAELLLDNIDNTFTTAVFNGSTSLRNAAGQMIESTVASAKRGEDVDGNYIKNLYANVTSLYKLNQLTGSGAEQELGKLPPLSIGLIVGISVIWLGFGAYYVYNAQKKKKSGTKADKEV